MLAFLFTKNNRVKKDELQILLTTIEKFCPFISLEEYVLYKDSIDFYPDYVLVGLLGKNDKNILLGFYSPGDFRPIDPFGHTLEALNKSVPLELNTEIDGEDYPRIWNYLELQLSTNRTLLGYDNILMPKVFHRYPSNLELKNADVIRNYITNNNIQAKGIYFLQKKDYYKVTIYMLSHTYEDGANTIFQEVRLHLFLDGRIEVHEKDGIREIDRYHEVFWNNLPKLTSVTRIKSALPIRKWFHRSYLTEKKLQANRIDANALSSLENQLELNFNLYSIHGRENIFIRLSPLTFYRSFVLLEVLILDSNRLNVKRKYALVALKNGNWDIRTMNGSSKVLYDVNEIDGELSIDDSTVDDYLRFFCWAVHGDEGPFNIPRYFRELNFNGQISLENVAIIKGYQEDEFTIVPFLSEDFPNLDFGSDMFFRKAPIFYGSSMFWAWFEINSKGIVNMLDDEPLVADIPIDIEMYDSEDLTTFGDTDNTLIQLPTVSSDIEQTQLKHYLIEKAKKRFGIVIDLNETRPYLHFDHIDTNLTGDQFKVLLEKDRGARDVVILDKVCLEGNLGQGKCNTLIIYGCKFDGAVFISNIENIQSIDFVHCKFENGLIAENSSIGASLNFVRCEMETPKIHLESETEANDKKKKSFLSAKVINFKNTSIAGDLLFFNCRIGGHFFAPKLHVNGNLIFKGCVLTTDFIRYMQNPIPCDPFFKVEVIEQLRNRQTSMNPSSRARSYDLISLQNATIEGNLEITAATSEPIKSSSVSKDISSYFDDSYVSFVDGPIDATGIEIHGKLWLTGTIIFDSLIFRNSSLKGDVVLGSFITGYFLPNDKSLYCRGNFDFANSKFDSTIDMGMIQIDGELIFQATTIAIYIQIENSIIGGDLTFNMGLIKNELSLLYVKIGGDFNINFATINGFMASYRKISKIGSKKYYGSPGPNLEVEGSIQFNEAKINIIEFSAIKVKGDIEVTTGQFGSISFTYDIIEDQNILGCSMRRFKMIGVEITESLDLSGLKIGEPWHQKRPEIISSNRVEPGITVKQSKIGKDIIFFQKHLVHNFDTTGEPIFNKGSIPSSTHNPVTLFYELYNHKNVEKANLDLTKNIISGTLDIRNIQVPHGNIILDQTSVSLGIQASAYIEVNDELCPLSIPCQNFYADNLFCGGDVKLSGITLVAHESFENLFVLRNGQVNGFLDLRNIKAIHGNFLLNDTAIKLDLNASATLKAEICQLECNSFSADNLVCNGDADFTGLHLNFQSNGEIKKQNLPTALFNMRNATINGTLLFCKPNYNPDDAYSQKNSKFPITVGARIESGNGNLLGLDLSNISTSHLVLTKDNLPRDTNKIILERAQIGRFEIIDPKPKPIDLSNIKVNRWVFGNDKEEKAFHYIDVLKEMSPFDRSVWVDVENSLRNKSLNREANLVYKAMREIGRGKNMFVIKKNILFNTFPKKDIWNVPLCNQSTLNLTMRGLFIVMALLIISSICLSIPIPYLLIKWSMISALSLLTIIFLYDRKGFEGVVISYGTKPFIPMILGLLLLAPTFILFSKPENVRATESVWGSLDMKELENRKRDDATYVYYNYESDINESINLNDSTTIVRPKILVIPELHPEPGNNWTSKDALALALRYQIPMIAYFTHNRWEASSKMTPIGVTVEQYAFFISIYHWIAWPIFLISVASQVFRGKRE